MEKLALYRTSHDLEDLDKAIALFRDASVAPSITETVRLGCVANMAYATDTRSRDTGRMDQLDDAITLYRETVDLRKPGQDGYLAHLDHFAQAVRRRYEHFGRIEDLAEVISLYRTILEHCPDDDVDLPAYTNNLAVSLKIRYERLNQIEDLDEAITLFRGSCPRVPTERPSNPTTLHNLSQALMARFGRTSQRDDLDEAIAFSRISVSCAPPSHPLRHAFVGNAIRGLAHRFILFGMAQDLDDEIDMRREILADFPQGSPTYIQSLAALISRLNTRFETFCRPEDVDQMIECFWLTFASLPPEQTTPHIGCLVALASELERRFDLFSRQEDLDDAITVSYAALRLCPDGHPLGAHAHILSCLIRFLRWRFQRSDEPEDLEELVRLGRSTLTVSVLDPMERFMFVNDLALDLSTRFDALGHSADLDDSITFHRRARELCPDNYPDRFKVLLPLAIRLMTRYKVSGRTQDLRESMLTHLETLALPPEATDRSRATSTSLHDLSRGAECFLQRLSGDGTFNEALQLYTSALEELNSPSLLVARSGSGARIHLPSATGAIMVSLLKHMRMETINESVGKYCETLALSVSRSTVPRSPVVDLAERFLEAGWSHDLDRRVMLYRDSLAVFPPGHKHHALCLSNLATSLMLRFDQVNNAQDLNEAVELYRASFQLSKPFDDAYYEIEVNFVWSLLVRFGCTGDFTNLVDAVTIHQEVLSHRGAYDAAYTPSKGSEDFVNCIKSRLSRLQSTENLEDAIEACCEAVILCSPGHPDRPRAQGGGHETFENGVKTHAELIQWSEELRNNAEESLIVLSVFLASGPKGPPLAGSGELLFILAQLYLIQHDLDLAFSIFETMPGGTVTQNFRTALMWARLAREHQHPLASRAYSRALQLSEQCIVMRPTVDSQYMFLTSDAARELSSLAASLAIDSVDLGVAVEMLERGRGQLWSRLRRYRHSNDEPVSESQSRGEGSDALASSVAGITAATEALGSLNIEEVFSEAETSRAFLAGIYSDLEKITTSTPDETYGPISTANVNSRFTRDSAPHRQLLNTLREMNESSSSQSDNQGPSHFLYTAPFDTLRSAAIGGPVIIVSISRYRSDALILRVAGDPIHVPLDGNLEDIVSGLCASLFKIKNIRHDEVVGSRAARLLSMEAPSMVDILRRLWEKICAPIVLALEAIPIEKHSRIWWCPTGALMQLPLHAAGPYEEGKENLCDLFVSSYTPSLSSLIQARKIMHPNASPLTTRLLAIGQSHALPQVSV